MSGVFRTFHYVVFWVFGGRFCRVAAAHLARDREPQPEPAVDAVVAVVLLLERPEDALLRVLVDADARVLAAVSLEPTVR